MTTSTGDVLGGTDVGLKVQVVFAGNPEQVKLICAFVAGVGVIVMCSVAVWPAVTVTEGSVKPTVNWLRAPMRVVSEAELLEVLTSPPPETVAVLTTDDAALEATFTVNVMSG